MRRKYVPGQKIEAQVEEVVARVEAGTEKQEARLAAQAGSDPGVHEPPPPEARIER